MSRPRPRPPREQHGIGMAGAPLTTHDRIRELARSKGSTTFAQHMLLLQKVEYCIFISRHHAHASYTIQPALKALSYPCCCVYQNALRLR